MSSNPFSTVSPDQRVAFTNEKITGPPAAELLRLSGIADYGQVDVLDNATGAGILVEHLTNLASEKSNIELRRVVAGDLDDNMLSFARNKQLAFTTADSRSTRTNVTIQKIDQQGIPYPDATFTHVFANFGIFFCRDDAKALSETYRVLTPGGTAGFTSWKGIRWWPEVAQPALAQYLTDAPALPSPDNMFPSPGWTNPAAIQEKLQQAGFKHISVSEYEFAPQVGSAEFGEATAVLVKVIAKKVWPDDQFALYAGQIEPAMLRYFEEHFGEGKRTAKMTALITLGRKGE